MITHAISEDPNLGALVWFTVRNETRPTPSALSSAVKAAGLPSTVLPKPINPRDALRRSITDLGRLPETDKGDLVERYLFREVPDPDSKSLVYHLIREIATPSNETLSYAECLSVCLKKHSTEVATTWLGSDTPSNQEFDIRDRLLTTWLENLRHHDSQAVRDVIQRVLQDTRPVSVRPSGGVYFVAGEYVESIDRLRRMVGALPGGSRVYSLPVLRSDDTEAMVQDSLAQDVEAQALRTVGALRRILASKSLPSEDEIQRAFKDLAGLAKLTETYELFLSDAATGARAALAAAQVQARVLLKQAFPSESETEAVS